MNDKHDRPISLLGIFVLAGMTGLLFALAQTGKPQFGKPQSISSAIDALPPSAAGQPSALAPAPVPGEVQRPESYLGGTIATGRVSDVYIRVADNVFLAVEQAPEHLKKSAERWVDVQFPELLANDTGSARAILNRSDTRVAVGDVVEIKFAHKDNPRYFPVKELTRVTELVASKDQLLARDYERRILARTGRGNSAPQWLSQATGAQPAAAPALQTTASEARR
jgi:hypothetical protein